MASRHEDAEDVGVELGLEGVGEVEPEAKQEVRGSGGGGDRGAEGRGRDRGETQVEVARGTEIGQLFIWSEGVPYSCIGRGVRCSG